MRKTFIFAFIFALATSFLPIDAGAATSGSLVKSSGPAVYYLLDGKRYVFPNERIYFSWYAGFDSVLTVSPQELASYRLGGNVTYRPGVKLVKIKSDPKTYAVSRGGVLRWITSEEVARSLYGAEWNTQVHDLSDAFFLDYRIGNPIDEPGSFDLLFETAIAGIFEDMTARANPVSGNTENVAELARAITNDVYAIEDGEWSNPKTWNISGTPGEGALVTIPFGRTVTYDLESASALTLLTIDGRLTIEPDANTTLASKMIVVNGSMSLGMSDEPVPASRHAALILTGSSSFGISDDGLLVNGTLDMHGAGRLVPWTTLGETADAESDTVTLKEEVDWVIGDEIFISTGSVDVTETERRTIIAIEAAVLTLDAPLAYTHRSDEFRRAEVAVLNRNVRIIGVGEEKGSRIVVSGRGEMRMSGVSLEGLGRKNIEGHHPIYFDAAGTAADSYVRNTVINRSGNGCIVLKQTNQVQIEDVVAVEIAGSCYVMKDGAVDAVSFKRNLVSSLSGENASGFIIRNPSAVLEGNVVIGATAYGYHYDLGESATRSDGHLMHPREAMLAGFSGNGAHAGAGHGLYVGGEGEYSPSVTAVFEGLDATFNAGYGFKLHGANLVVTGAHLVANRVGGSFSAFAADFFDSTVVGFPDYVATEIETDIPAGGDHGRFGFIFTDGPVSVNGVTFKNFMAEDGVNTAAFSFEPSNPRVPDARNNYRNITFVDAQKWFVYPPDATGDFLAVVRDFDNDEMVASADPFLDYACLEGVGHIMTCRGTFSQLLVIFRDANTSQAVRFTRSDTGASFTLHPGAAFDGRYAYITVPEGPGYVIDGPMTRSITLDWSGALIPILLRIPVTELPNVTMGGGASQVATDPAPGEYTYDDMSREILIHLPAGQTADITW